ncbi:heterodisulfide reductase subunit C [Pseudodesulfovibrio sp. F-1]|uniref:Heterodisulfide reductase subunit C n=1 Tax=Pseudodesulfovibrio alkaliphilus TaxID=2661613 RepID=A0A7K1KPR5_9BACT|nr:4Fe-4S dicluster domain-containing protein [Pseudodesulfovibrio alkaliphilus]MUM77871.1 heterodisulfide reductase subunit C [Pseudodesulfovibrio alkaliphilus]
MNTISLDASHDADFVRQVEAESGQNLSLCYQCGNCTAGCPYTSFYDIPVSQIMRLVQAGQRDTVLSCKSLWLCATCESCTTRCPNNIDVARIMDVLRHMARRAGHAPEPAIKAFWDSFLDSVKKHGRVFEMGVVAGYMLKTGRVLTDADLAKDMLPKGKLSFRPHPIVGRQSVIEIFKRYHEERKS